MTVKEAWDPYRAQYVETRRRNESDRQTIEGRFRNHVLPVLGHLPLEALRRWHLSDLRARLIKRGLSPQTQRHVMVEFNSFLRWCHKAELGAPPLFEPAGMPRVQKRLANRLSDEEVEALKALPEPWGFYCRLGLGTGLRYSELCRAQASDIDWSHEIPVLRVPETKTYEAREVPFRPWLADELHRKAGRLFPFDETRKSTAFNRRIQRLSSIAGFGAHRMRHTFCCMLGNDGMPLHHVSRIMGHRRLETTSRYVRQGDGAARREAARIYGRLEVSTEVSSGRSS
jgi:integrase/recombinase XerD